MRPFWVVNPTLADRQTCLCKVHENLTFLAEKLHTLKLIRSVDMEDLTSSISCNPNSKDCMYNECPHCKGQEFAIAAEVNLQANVKLTQWSTETVIREKKNKDGKKDKVPMKITVKKKKDIVLADLLEMFQGQLRHFKRHTFNIKSQFTHYRELRKSMTNQECLIHVDFSENYSCKLAAEIQAMHFAPNQKQATLHTGILPVGGTAEHMCFGTISASKEKGPSAIWAHLSPILDEVKASYPSVEVVHFFSDGPCTQYRQKGNFFLFSTELMNRGFKRGTWNFFEASHGKGAPDGVGGLLKRTADRLVSQGHDIPSAEPSDSIGQWCALKYDEDIYPGVIQEVMDTHVQVKCMHVAGVNRFFWPLREDVLLYPFEDILSVILPPKSVTSRDVEIDKDIWSSF
ncbi:hypothetical protein KUCAC02_014755 [Chaenocephalus aceratus]|uniref:Uncharacterized protein n=1 Tax=Chaenocephalus aceratus TaxID=36190 RepID=A0ACB9WER2_CHAAC|nr:hypothetical protein KUCAC02_014755 [Chaenocephalus aceratus]